MNRFKFSKLSFSIALIVVCAFFGVFFGGVQQGTSTIATNVSSPNQLIECLSSSSYYNDSSVTITLTSDINLSSADLSAVWTAQESGPFMGTIDGNGYTITIGSIASNTAYYGLLGQTKGATIKNLRIAGNNDVIEVDVSQTDTTAVYIGSLIGYGESTTLQNCEFSSFVLQSVDSDNDGTNDLIATKFTAGAVAGILFSASSLENVVSYASVDLATSLAAQNMAKIGGLVGRIENAHLLRVASFGDIKFYSTSSNITFYVGGAVGEIEGTQTTVIDTVYSGTIASRQANQGTVYIGGVCGSISSTAPDEGNIGYNYYSGVSEAFGLNTTYSLKSGYESYTAEQTITYALLSNKENWHPSKAVWDFELTFMYSDSGLCLQVFQEFEYELLSPLDNSEVLSADSTKLDKATGVYKYGETVTITLSYASGKTGYYELNEILLSSSALSSSYYTVTTQYSSDNISGYVVTFMASDATDGSYSFSFSTISYKLYLYSEDYFATGEAAEIDKGGVRFAEGVEAGDSTSKTLTIESNTQTVVAVSKGIYTFKEWKLYLCDENGNLDTEVALSTGENSNISVKLGSGEFATISNFALVAYFTDEDAIAVSFTFDETAGIISNVKFSGTALTSGASVLVSSTSSKIELSFTVADGYVFDVDTFITEVSRLYGTNSTNSLKAYSTSLTDTGTTYTFNINMKYLTGSLSANSVNLSLAASEEVVEDDGLPLWVWLVICGGALIVVGALVAWFVHRRRSAALKKTGGGAKGGAKAGTKQKAQKSKKDDYKNYY